MENQDDEPLKQKELMEEWKYTLYFILALLFFFFIFIPFTVIAITHKFSL